MVKATAAKATKVADKSPSPDQSVKKITAWRKDPVLFVRECLQAQPDPWQIAVLNDYRDHQRVAMCASKGVGKSTVLAWIIWHFMSVHLDPLVACTSISSDNLRDGLWSELARWQRVSPFLSQAFSFSAQRIEAIGQTDDGLKVGDTWYCSARHWSKSADRLQQSNTLAGLHALNLMFVIDEAGAIPDAVVAAAEAGLATIGGTKRMVIAGNPTNLEGPLYRACVRDASSWHVTRITSDPDDPMRSTRVSLQWALDQIRIYGRTNPWVLVNVFGQFPPSSMNSLVGPAEVEASFARQFALNSQDHCAKVIGVDVARYGDDRSCIVRRQGQAMMGAPVEMRGAETIAVASMVAKIYNEWAADCVFVDASGGHGVGVIDVLRQSGVRVIEVHFSGSPNEATFFNKRSEIWWQACNWVKSASLPNVPDIVREFSEPKYYLQGGLMRLEEKEQVKARLGYSPDMVDALACTFATPIVKQVVDGLAQQRHEATREKSRADWRSRFLGGNRPRN